MAVIDRIFGAVAPVRDVRPPERVGKNLMATSGGALYQLEGSASGWPTGMPDDYGPTPDEAMSYSPWYRAVWILSSTMALTPCHVMRQKKAKTGYDKTPDIDHRFYDAVYHQANDEETAFQAKLRMTSYAVVHGNALAVIFEPRGGGDPELIPILPGHWTMTRRDGQLWYMIDVYGEAERNISKRYRKVKPDKVFHLRHWTPDGLLGYATWHYARYALTEGTVGKKVRTARGRNAGRPALALTTDQKLPAGHAERLQNDFVRVHEGFDGSAKPAIFDMGLTPVALPYSADQKHEAALAELPIIDIANFTGVPASWLGVSETEANSEADELKFHRYGIGFWYGAFEDEGKAKFLTEQERYGQTHTVEFDVLSREWRDTKGRNDMIRTYLAGQPAATVNEIRQRLGWGPREEPEADELQQPLNMGEGGGQNEPTDKADPRPGRPKKTPSATVDPALNELVAHQAARMAKWVTAAARRHATGPKAFVDFVSGMDIDFGPRFKAEWDVLHPLGVKPVDMLATMRTRFVNLSKTTEFDKLKEAVEALCVQFETTYPLEVANEAT